MLWPTCFLTMNTNCINVLCTIPNEEDTCVRYWFNRKTRKLNINTWETWAVCLTHHCTCFSCSLQWYKRHHIWHWTWYMRIKEKFNDNKCPLKWGTQTVSSFLQEEKTLKITLRCAKKTHICIQYASSKLLKLLTLHWQMMINTIYSNPRICIFEKKKNKSKFSQFSWLKTKGTSSLLYLDHWQYQKVK